MKWQATKAVEAAGLALLLAIAGVSVFFRRWVSVYPFEAPYILFPLFAWAALRFDLRGATVATAFVSTLAIWATVTGSGPFARDALATGLLALQTFMGCAAITTLTVAGVTMDRARAIRVQDSILAMVSHDFKSPLSALTLSAESLLRRPTQEAVEKHGQVLRRSVDRMMRLATDLLDASSIERGRLAVEPKPEDARSLITEAIDLMRPLATAKSVNLRSDKMDSIEVVCDRGRILQVLSNLVGNAIKFSPEQATITVRVEGLQDGARFSVRDTGPGIPARDLPHIFERYWHTKPSAGGASGLGLFIAKGIVQAHGASLWAESEVGVGSVFHFTLPLCRDRSPRSRARAGEPALPGGHTS